jgi:drug/metabolite transporter (DMT)-like permease
VPSWPAHGWLALLAVNSQVLGWLLISVSLPRLPAAVTSVLLMLQPTAAVLLAMVVLGESPSALQLAGVAVVVAGVALAATARTEPSGSVAADAPPDLAVSPRPGSNRGGRGPTSGGRP